MGRKGITVVQRGARRTMEIGHWKKDSIWCVATTALGVRGVCVFKAECVLNNNECCCSKDKTSMFLSFPLQASDVYCSVKASSLKEIRQLNSKRLLCAFVCELHCECVVSVHSQEITGTAK